MVQDILASNYFVPIDEETDLDSIVIDTKPKKNYKNEYEKELLTRDPGNEDYKIIDIKVGNSTGYVVAIYDPKLS